LGGVVAWHLTGNGYRARLSQWLWPLAILAVSMIWMISNKKYAPINIAVFGLCLGLLIPLFQENQWGALRTTSKIIARYSYGSYLTHFAVILFVLNDPRYAYFKVIRPIPQLKHHARPVDLTMIFVFIALASFLLYHLIEAPGMRVGKRLAKWLILPNPAPASEHEGGCANVVAGINCKYFHL
jgi:peptidoglycan/LPS O-acetylase OafA/YrhL